jgi:hypothetical protein
MLNATKRSSKISEIRLLLVTARRNDEAVFIQLLLYLKIASVANKFELNDGLAACSFSMTGAPLAMTKGTSSRGKFPEV